MYMFDVTFCTNGWEHTLNPDDPVTVTVEIIGKPDFDKARKIARKKVTEMGYSGRHGWKWNSTALRTRNVRTAEPEICAHRHINMTI